MKISGYGTYTPSIQKGVKLSPELEQSLGGVKAPGGASENFGDLLMKKIDEVDQMQKASDVAAQDFASGKSRNLHETVLAMEMAETSLRLMVTVRNKAVEAYQEIMRMPI